MYFPDNCEEFSPFDEVLPATFWDAVPGLSTSKFWRLLYSDILVEETSLLHYDSDQRQTFSHKTEEASRTLLILC